MKTTENPIMEYLHTILERTDQLVDDVSDLRHRMARLEKIILEKKSRTPVRRASKDSKDDTNQLVNNMNVLSKDPERLKQVAESLGLHEQSVLLRIKLLTHSLEQSRGGMLTKLDTAEAQLICSIE